MKFNTYVINLQKDIDKWKKIQVNFKNTGLQLIRFNAINGKNIQRTTKKFPITKFCNTFCNDGMIGCGLSHIKLADTIYKNDKNNFSLILEDDVFPIKNDIKQSIINLVKNTPKNWDIIKIYNVGFCKQLKNPMWLCGSTAGYLLSKKGALKLSKLKLNYHIDIQIHNNKYLNIYKSKTPLLDVCFNSSNISKFNFLTKINNKKNKILGAPLFWFLNQVSFKIPYLNINVTYLHLLFLLLSLSYYFFKLTGFFISIIILLFYLIIGFVFYT